MILFVSREQTLGQELGFDGALGGGSVRRKGQSACELIVPRRCPMRGSLDAVHLQEPARSVRHTKPYRALRKKKAVSKLIIQSERLFLNELNYLLNMPQLIIVRCLCDVAATSQRLQLTIR